MWTTLSSLADRHSPATILLAAVLAVPLASCGVDEVPPAPDAPRAVATAPPEREVMIVQPEEVRQLELLEVTIRRLDEGEEPLARLAGSTYWATASEPLVLEARLAPFPLPVGTSSPVLVLNGETLHETTIHPGVQYTLVAFLPDRSALQADNRITVRWIGREGPERPKTMVLRRAEIEAQLED
ncbi:MAG: hypothetical protein ACC700_15830 [Anaerolineales bacterium]